MNPNEFFNRPTGPRVLIIDNVHEVHLAEDGPEASVRVSADALDRALKQSNILKNRLASLLNTVVLRLPEEV